MIRLKLKYSKLIYGKKCETKTRLQMPQFQKFSMIRSKPKNRYPIRNGKTCKILIRNSCAPLYHTLKFSCSAVSGFSH